MWTCHDGNNICFKSVWKRSHVWLTCLKRERSRLSLLYNTPSHTRARDGQGTGGRRPWHFMKQEALSGIPLVLCAWMCLCVREEHRRREWERQKCPSWLFLCLNMVWKTKRGQGGVTRHHTSHHMLLSLYAITGQQLFSLSHETNVHVEYH